MFNEHTDRTYRDEIYLGSAGACDNTLAGRGFTRPINGRPAYAPTEPRRDAIDRWRPVVWAVAVGSCLAFWAAVAYFFLPTIVGWGVALGDFLGLTAR